MYIAPWEFDGSGEGCNEQRHLCSSKERAMRKECLDLNEAGGNM